MYRLWHLFLLQGVAAIGAAIFVKFGPGHLIVYLFTCLGLLLAIISYRRFGIRVVGLFMATPAIMAAFACFHYSDEPKRWLITYGFSFVGIVASSVANLVLIAFGPRGAPRPSKAQR